MVKYHKLSAGEVYPAAVLMATMMQETGPPAPGPPELPGPLDRGPGCEATGLLLTRLVSELMADILAGIAVVYLAMVDDTPVGTVEVKEIRTVAGCHLEVFRLYVDPFHRDKGIAGRLLHLVVKDLPADLECPVLLSTNGPVPRSYARMGFTPVSTVSATSLGAIKQRMKVRNR